jgi:2-keto-4-pentenoate hydratase
VTEAERAEAAARAIWSAWQEGRSLAALPDAVRPRDTTEGWAAQEALEALVEPRVGWKLAATSPPGQRHLQVDAPIPGRLFPRFLAGPGDTVPAGHVLRVAEAEIAFRLAGSLEGGPFGREEVLAAVAAMHLAVEVPDTRFERPEAAGAPQLAADDACAGWFVLGPEVPGWRELDLVGQRVRILLNGAEAASGVGGNVLGDPCEALTWLANELAARGGGLRAGEVVTTGTTTVPVPVVPGDRVEAEFEGLGSVRVQLGP